MRRSGWWLGGLAAASLVAVTALAQTNAADQQGPEAGIMMSDPGMCQGMMGMMGGGMGTGGMMGMGSGMGMMDGMGMGRGGMLMRRLFALNLSDDQVTRIRGIMENTEKQAIPKKADIHVKDIELLQLLEQPQPAASQIDAKVGEISNAKRDLELVYVHALLQVRGVLTADQLQQFLNPTWHPSGMQMQGGAGQGPMRRER